MLDLNRTLFYKASIDISMTSGSDILWPIVFEIKNWMISKWKPRGISLPEDNKAWGPLTHKGHIESSDPDKTVSIESAIYYDEANGNKWACSVCEIIKDEGLAYREWRTDLGFSWSDEQSGVLSLVLTYGDQPGYLGLTQNAPSPTIPGIIRRLDSNNRIVCTVSGKALPFEPVRLSVGGFADFWSFVTDRERSIPVIFISPLFEGNQLFLVNPWKIAKALGPTAIVYFSDEPGFMSEMNACLPSMNLRCTDGAIRIYSAGKSLTEPWKHRFFNKASIDALGDEDGLISIIRRAFAQDVHFYENMDRLGEVKNLVRRSSFKKEQLLRVSAAQKVAGEIQSEYDEFLESHNDALDCIDRLESELEELRQEKRKAEAKARYYEQAMSSISAVSPDRSVVRLFPATNKEIVNLFLESYPSRFDLTKRAWSSLESCEANAETLWNALYYICTLLYSLWKDGASVDIEKRFNDSAQGFEYKRGEGSQSRNNKSLMSSRYDKYDGRTIFAEPHISKGNFRGKSKERSIRIYLAFDDPSGMIVLSSIGEHMENYSTQHLR